MAEKGWRSTYRIVIENNSLSNIFGVVGEKSKLTQSQPKDCPGRGSSRAPAIIVLSGAGPILVSVAGAHLKLLRDLFYSLW